MECKSRIERKKKSDTKKQQNNKGLTTLRVVADVSRVVQLVEKVWNYVKEHFNIFFH